MSKVLVAVSMALEQPYKRHVAVFAGIQEYAEKRGDWQLVVDDWADRSLPAAAGRRVPFDGMVGRISRSGGQRARRLGIPVVNVHFSAPWREQLPGVFADFAECGRLRAEHLLAHGFRRFGALLHELDLAAAEEADSFDRTVRSAGCAEADRLVLPAARRAGRQGIGDSDLSDYRAWRRAMRLIDRWLDRWTPPIGLYVFDAAVARIIIRKCLSRGLQVPDDVAVIAGYNEEIQCECAEPTITSLELPYERIGWEAARLLDGLIARSRSTDGSGPAPPQTLLLPPVGIVERQSTDFHAVKDELVRRALGCIGAQLRKPIRLDELARRLEVSRVTLTTRFRQVLGVSVHSEVRRLRVERAKRELTGSDADIGSVAVSSGFGGVRNLNRVFRAAVGCTPTEYRNGCRPSRRTERAATG